MSDLISRQAAVEALEIPKVIDLYDHYWNGRNDQYKKDVDAIADLPSAQHKTDYSDGYADGYRQGMKDTQPEIIRCKDCKYRDENWRRVSVKWLPCMDMRTGSNWYCGSAERRGEQE